jgi:hypothetical protein
MSTRAFPALSACFWSGRHLTTHSTGLAISKPLMQDLRGSTVFARRLIRALEDSLMRLKKTLKIAIATVTFIAMMSVTMPAQKSNSAPNLNGKLRGLTIDFMGAIVPKVAIIFESDQLRREVVSDEDGGFEIALPAGLYRVRVEKFSIFDTFEDKKLKVKGGSVKKFDIMLKYDSKKYPPVT